MTDGEKMQATVLTLGADIGGHFADFGAALANHPPKQTPLTGIMRTTGEFVPQPETDPDLEQLIPAELPAAVLPADENRGFYLTFSPPEVPEGFEAVLAINGRLAAAELWLDGVFITTVRNCLFGAEIRLSELKSENALFLRILKNMDAGGDVLRGLSLQILPKTRFSDAYFRAQFDESGVSLIADFTVIAGDVDAALGETVRLSVLDGEENTVVSGAADVPAFRRNYWSSVRIVTDRFAPRRWDPDDPYRYILIMELLRADGSVADVRRIWYGIRDLVLTPHSQQSGAEPRMLLNGRPFKITGIATRRQTPEAVEQAKALGCNAMRVIDPHDSDFFDTAEKTGMLLFAEASFTVRSVQKQRRGKEADPLDRPLALMGELVTRLKNRASVICWSLGSRGIFGTGVLKEMIRSLDDTRAICCEGDTRFSASDFFAAADCGSETLLDVAEHKPITDGKLFGSRVAFSRYRHKPLLLTDVFPDAAAIREKLAVIRAHDRLFGLFADMTETDDFSLLRGAMAACEVSEGNKPEQRPESETNDAGAMATNETSDEGAFDPEPEEGEESPDAPGESGEQKP